MPLIRTTFRDLPRPSARAHPDPDWHLLTPLGWRALADPDSVTLWPDANSRVPSHAPIATALEILAFTTGWPRLDLGVQRWRISGYRPLTPALGLVKEIAGDGLDDLTDWLVRSCFAHDIESRTAEAVGVPLAPNRRHGGGDEMHLSVHGLEPVIRSEVRTTLYLADDAAVPSAALHLSDYAGWYRHLARVGDDLGSHPSGRSWRIAVTCTSVGWLGTYRRSRTSGRWFRDRHAVHQMGIADG